MFIFLLFNNLTEPIQNHAVQKKYSQGKQIIQRLHIHIDIKRASNPLKYKQTEIEINYKTKTISPNIDKKIQTQQYTHETPKI